MSINVYNASTDTLVKVAGMYNSGPTIPDGKTVTPINDVTIWQQCAGIANPTYTTLNEILADVGMLSTLMSSNNAVDYLLRSKKFIDNRLVPKMTSNTAPSGIASASSELLTYEAYMAFDRDIKSKWEATTTGGTQTGYLQYDFGEPTKVAGLKLVNWSVSGTYTQTLKNITVSGSNDGNTFTTITSENVNISEDKYEYTKVFNAEYNIYRVSITSTQSYSAANNPSIREVQFYSDGIGITQSADAMQYIGQNNYASNTLLADSDWCDAICNSTYFESVLNVKIPTMTSDTTPSGVASALRFAAESYHPYRAFDGSIGSGWEDVSATFPTWVMYEFPNAKVIKFIKLLSAISWVTLTAKTYTVKLQGSNDGFTNDINDLSTITVNSSDSKNFVTEVLSNNTAYKYYRLYYTEGTFTNNQVNCAEFQLYGREDV